MRDAVATALGNVEAAQLSPKGYEALIQLSKDKNDEVRFSAIFEIASWWLPAATFGLRRNSNGHYPTGTDVWCKSRQTHWPAPNGPAGYAKAAELDRSTVSSEAVE